MSTPPERPRPDNWEPAEPDPGPGWLRSRFMGLSWPREGHWAACGRAHCPICECHCPNCDPANQVSQKFECAPIVPPSDKAKRERESDDDILQKTEEVIPTDEAIHHLRHYFHIYEGWSYYTLRCGICGQTFGIQPTAPLMERGSFEMLMEHATAHNETPTCALDYSRRYTEGGPPKGEVSR